VKGIEVAEDKEPHRKPRALEEPPRTKTTTHRGSRRGSMSKSMQSGADRRDISRFAKPENTSRMMARIGVANTRHARKGAPPGVVV
jgi:hypothetical protein